MLRKYLYTGLGCAVAAGGLALALGSSSARPEPPPSAARAVDATLCEGGPEGDLRVELVPNAVKERGGRAHLVLAVETTHLTQRPGRRVERGLRILTPDGRQIGEERKLGRGEIAQGLTQADEVELPNLEDGYYRVTARAGDEAGSESSQLYVRVKKGQQEPVSFDEWYTKSGAGDFGGPDAPADGEKR